MKNEIFNAIFSKNKSLLIEIKNEEDKNIILKVKEIIKRKKILKCKIKK